MTGLSLQSQTELKWLSLLPELNAYLSESKDTFFGANHTAFQHQEIIVHFSVVWESTLGETRGEWDS